MSNITKREMKQIKSLKARGFSLEQIALRLDKRPSTIEWYLITGSKRYKFEQLRRKGINKESICDSIKISSATYYRWIAEYYIKSEV